MSLLVHQETFETPSLVGLTLHEAISRVAPYKLPFFILEEVEEAAVPETLILSQKPIAGQKIKKYQSIGIVITKKPAPEKAPFLKGNMLKEIQKNTQFKIKPYYIESHQPTHTCLAQSPEAGKALASKTIIAYISNGLSSLRIMPDLKGCTLEELQNFLQPYEMETIIFPREYASHQRCEHCIIQTQKPLAGSIIDVQKPPIIQVTVKHISHQTFD